MTCYLATVIANNKIDDAKKKDLIRQPFRQPWRCARALQTTLPDAAYPGLLRKPLDAGIGPLLAPYFPSGCQDDNQQNNNQTIHQQSWLF